jgi:hypothetical protein
MRSFRLRKKVEEEVWNDIPDRAGTLADIGMT